MNRPYKVTPLPDFKIEVSYPDGTTGQIDMSESVQSGVFTSLADEAFFNTVHIGEFGQIAWSEDLEICADSAYREIKGKISSEVQHA